MQILSVHKAFIAQLLDGRKTQTRRVTTQMANFVDGAEEYTIQATNEHEIWRIETAWKGLTDAALFAPKLSIGETFRFEGVDSDFTCTGIRCERLQEISDKDCEAEGVQFSFMRTKPYRDIRALFWVPQLSGECADPVWAFKNMWSHIYPTGPKSWESNPPVFVYEFEYIGKEGE